MIFNINFEIIYEKESSEHTIQNEIMDTIVDEGIVEFGDLYMDAREGFVYLVDTEEIIIEPEPEKRWSLYGEEYIKTIF